MPAASECCSAPATIYWLRAENPVNADASENKKSATPDPAGGFGSLDDGATPAT
jgi:hypothetical protein